MDQVYVIRHKVLVEGQSRRAVAQQMDVSRNTVRKYLEVSEPVGKQRAHRERPVLEKVRQRLDELVDEWRGRTTRKQRITAARLHEQLICEGYKVGVTTVRNYWRECRRQHAEVYVPLVHRAGDEAQVDFFEVVTDINGTRVKCWMFVIRLMYSGRDFAWLYEHCDQVSFLDGHVRAFAHFEGVVARCIYDNLSPAVAKVLFPGRKLTARFAALVSHYLFEPCFARPGTGHDKGGVEGRGKVLRYQHLVPIPAGGDIEEISHALLGRLDRQSETKRNAEGHTVAERFVEEQALFRPLPAAPFEPRLAKSVIANSKALVTALGGTYSVPSHWKSLEFTAYIGPRDVRFVCRDEVICRKRVRRGQKNVKYTDYLHELRRKPQAVRQVAPELLSCMSEPFAELWRVLQATHGGREAGRVFAKVLGAVVEHGEEAVSSALRRAIDGGRGHLLELGQLVRQPLPTEVEIPESLRQHIVESTCAADYDRLLEDEVLP